MRDTASLTAMGAALMRAVHTRRDIPRVVDDPWADRLLTDGDRAALLSIVEARLDDEERAGLSEAGDRETALEAVLQASAPYGGVVLRTRYAEECLEQAVRDGTGQYVIVGAGLDSFALRRPAWAADLQIFEVDHPATQRHKRERLKELGVAPRGALHFVAADFADDGLDVALLRSPFDRTARAFFAWLGVTTYLTREQNLGTLRAIARVAAPGSELVFTYTDQRALDALALDADASVTRAGSAVAAAGEPWVSGFDPATLAADLRATGLELVEDLGGTAMHDRYLAADEGPFPRPSTHITRARR